MPAFVVVVVFTVSMAGFILQPQTEATKALCFSAMLKIFTIWLFIEKVINP